MSARERILAKIRKKNSTTLTSHTSREKKQFIRSSVATISQEKLLTLFIEKLDNVSATYNVINSLDDVAKTIRTYLEQQDYNLNKLRSAPALEALNIHWDFEISYGVAREDDIVSVTSIPYAVAETGTLVSPSSEKRPISLNFLAEINIAILHSTHILPSYEEVWSKITHNKLSPPRTVNFITGPSRTGDIEQTLLLGVHGPKKLHVLIISDHHENKP